MKSPKWTREEVILAMDLYFRVGQRVPNPTDPEVIDVSRLLNKLEVHNLKDRTATFRNPSGVVLKIANLRALDPNNPGLGMSRGSAMDQIVWDEFANDLDGLRQEANWIKAGVDSINPNLD